MCRGEGGGGRGRGVGGWESVQLTLKLFQLAHQVFYCSIENSLEGREGRGARYKATPIMSVNVW